MSALRLAYRWFAQVAIVWLSAIPCAGTETSALAGEPVATFLDGTTERLVLTGILAQGELLSAGARPSALRLDDLLEWRLPDATSRPGPPQLTFAVHLRNGSTLRVTAVHLADEQVTLTWPLALAPVTLSIDEMARVEWPQPQAQPPPQVQPPDRSRLARERTWVAAPDVDRLIIRDGDSWLNLTGLVTTITAAQVEWETDGMARRFASDRVVALVLASPPGPARPGATRMLQLVDGSLLSSTHVTLEKGVWSCALGEESRVQLPGSSVRRLVVRSSRVTWLSELVPERCEQQSLAAAPLPWRRDAALTGGPLRLAGETYERGIALQAQTHCEFKLEGRYELLVARVGLDDAAGGHGDCEISVRGDASVPLAAWRQRGADPPRDLRLTVTGQRRMQLRVDYGAHLDLADHVDWAAARLIAPAQLTP
ncbi:MAG: NPCBM/NEW2 domain-containing protein [Pirellulales bacterium]